MVHRSNPAAILTLLVSIALSVWPTGTTAAPDVYKFGAVLILSGGSASVGEHMQKGVECAVADINGAGGIQGVPMKAIYEDGRARAPRSRSTPSTS
jgi:ABC-type branched-subunit amino acid transport system substrate-binding protein